MQLQLTDIAEGQGKHRCKTHHTLLFACNPTGNTVPYTLREVIEPDSQFTHVVNEEGCNGSRCFQMGVGNIVEDSLVALVANACDDGKRHLGNANSKGIGIEIAEIAGGATSTDDGHNIPLVCLLGYLLQCLDDGLLYPTALHDSGEELDNKMKTKVVVLELVTEVPIASRRLTADDGYASRK